MRLIAEEAGMTASNLLYHFKTKRDLLLEILRDLEKNYEQKTASCITDSDDTLEGKLASFFEQKKHFTLHEPDSDKAQFDFWVLSQSDTEVRQLYRGTYQLWHNHISDIILHYRPSFDPQRADMLAYNMIALMMGGTMQYLGGGGFDLDVYHRNSLEMILHQIGE